jgi:hypothetical protein
VSPLEPPPPPVGEEVHLPEPSVLPVLVAIGITLTLIGFTTFIELTFIGGVLTIACAIAWIRRTREEVDELPLE